MSLFIIRPLVCNACDDTSYEEYEYVYCLSQTCEEGIAIFPENVAMETIMETIRVWTKWKLRIKKKKAYYYIKIRSYYPV